jgi:hypothetical protein
MKTWLAILKIKFFWDITCQETFIVPSSVFHVLVSVHISENYLPKAQSIRTYVRVLTIFGEPTGWQRRESWRLSHLARSPNMFYATGSGTKAVL